MDLSTNRRMRPRRSAWHVVFALVCGIATRSHAGEVIAAVDAHGDLFVAGSSGADSVAMVHVASSNHWFVKAGAPTTSINGVNTVAFVVTRDVVIDLRGGDDEVQCAGAVPRDLRIRLGAGVDEARVYDATVGRDLRVVKGPDRDTFDLKKSAITRDVRIDSGGPGVDFAVRTSSIGRDLTVRFGGGPAFAGAGESRVESVTVGRRLTMKGKSAVPIEVTDVIVAGNASITTTAPNAVVVIGQSEFGASFRARGPANFSVSLVDTLVNGKARVVAGKGQLAQIGVVHCVFGADVLLTSLADETLTSFIHPTDVGGRLRIDLRSKTSTWSWLSRLHVVGDIVFVAKGASDTVVFTESTAEADARFLLGGGANDVSVSAVSVVGDLAITAGTGDDAVSFVQVSVGGSSVVATGAGADTFVEIP